MPGTDPPGSGEPPRGEPVIYDKWCGFCNIHFQTTNPLKVYCKPSHKVRAAELRRRLKSLELLSASNSTKERV